MAFRKTNEQSLKEVISQLLDLYRLKGKYNEVNIVQSWAEIMGPTVANRTEEVYIRDKKLYIRLSSAALRHELSRAKERIVVLVNEKAGTELVKEVVLI